MRFPTHKDDHRHCGTVVPTLRQHAWTSAKNPTTRVNEIAALRTGKELDPTLVDTAEPYAVAESEFHRFSGRAHARDGYSGNDGRYLSSSRLAG